MSTFWVIESGDGVHRPAGAAPPVFEQIFRNARFAQGGNAHFQGKLRGNPKPQVSWTRKSAPLFGEYRAAASTDPTFTFQRPINTKCPET